MTLPIELISLLLSANGALITIAVHLLIRIGNRIGDMNVAYQVEKTKTEEKLLSLTRHEARNRQELEWMARHMGVPQRPQQQRQE